VVFTAKRNASGPQDCQTSEIVIGGHFSGVQAARLVLKEREDIGRGVPVKDLDEQQSRFQGVRDSLSARQEIL